jgi:hypothetical protein
VDERGNVQGLVQAAVAVSVQAVPDVVVEPDVDGCGAGVAGEVGLAGKAPHVTNPAEGEGRHQRSDGWMALTWEGCSWRTRLVLALINLSPPSNLSTSVGWASASCLRAFPTLVSRPDSGQQLSSLDRSQPARSPAGQQLSEQLVQPVHRHDSLVDKLLAAV